MLIMASAIGKKTKQIAYLLALVYFSSYFMRINFAVMMVKICSDMQVEKSALAIVVTGLTVAYGTGQVISGVLGDRIKPQYLITAGLSLATLCNVCISLCSGIPAMTAVWCVNGFAHALMPNTAMPRYAFPGARRLQPSCCICSALYYLEFFIGEL